MTSEVVAEQLTSIKTILFSAFYIIYVVCNYLFTRWFLG